MRRRLLASTLGTSWEFVEFTTDWFGHSDLQPSPADTMSDVMSNCIGAYAATGVDRISVGALTHSAPAVDISMEVTRTWR